jgi:signal peptidase I
MQTEEHSPIVTTRSRTRRAPDYRLRGLDLDAPDIAEASTRAVRKKHPSRGRRRRRLFVQWVAVLIVAAAVAVLLRATAFEPFAVRSTAMAPTLSSGTDVLVVKSSLLRGSIHAGDIIVFRAPAGANCTSVASDAHQLVKRVIGLPGQTIWSAKGVIYVNGRRLNEPGWYNPPFGELGQRRIFRTTIPAGSYFVMGDNRTDTCDSRSFGPMPKSLLVGKVVATISRNGHPFVHGL